MVFVQAFVSSRVSLLTSGSFSSSRTVSRIDATWLAEVGAFYNVKGDRAKAEELFDRAFRSKSDEVWRTLDIAGSYLGLEPHGQ